MNSVEELDTPAVTIRVDIMEDNIRRVQAYLDQHGIANRPHIKTHKIPALGKLQMQAGAQGITCQKLGEVEVFTDAGVADDVLLTFNIVGTSKLERLMALSKRLKRLAVVLDSEAVRAACRMPHAVTAQRFHFSSSATPVWAATACKPRRPHWTSHAQR